MMRANLIGPPRTMGMNPSPQDISRFRRFFTEGPAHECWVWQGYRHRGYGLFRLGGRPHAAHRVAFAIAIGPLEQGKVISHDCDNPGCVNPAHLRQQTQADNVHDSIRRGRFTPGTFVYTQGSRLKGVLPSSQRGERHPNAKLTTEVVARIRAAAATMTRTEIARELGVSRSTVGRVLSGETWGHVS